MMLMMMKMEAVIIILFLSSHMRMVNDHGSQSHFSTSVQRLFGKPTSYTNHLIVSHNNLWLNRKIKVAYLQFPLVRHEVEPTQPEHTVIAVSQPQSTKTTRNNHNNNCNFSITKVNEFIEKLKFTPVHVAVGTILKHCFSVARWIEFALN